MIKSKNVSHDVQRQYPGLRNVQERTLFAFIGMSLVRYIISKQWAARASTCLAYYYAARPAAVCVVIWRHWRRDVTSTAVWRRSRCRGVPSLLDIYSRHLYSIAAVCVHLSYDQ